MSLKKIQTRNQVKKMQLDTAKQDAKILSQRWRFEALLEEFKALREEELDTVRHQQQLILYTYLIAAGGIPVALSLLNGTNIQILAALLIGLSVLFSSILLAHTGYTNSVWTISHYINQFLSPQINSLVESLGIDYKDTPVLWWESYIRTRWNASRGETMLRAFMGFGEIPLMLFPSAGCILLLFYITYSSSIKWPVVHYYLIYGVMIYFFICILTTAIFHWLGFPSEPGIPKKESPSINTSINKGTKRK